MDEILTSAWSGPVVFRGIHFRVGYLIIDCLDEGSADWLKIAVISRKNDGAGALLVVGMDQTGRDEIVERDHKLNFRFGHVTVSGLKKTKKAPEETPNDGICKAVEDTLEPLNVEPKLQSGEQDGQSITSMDIGDDQGDGHPIVRHTVFT
ncbi:uncharacterized protein LOC128253439 [Drosophila gunungcola]|uniref:uncharacterized protein LOC128253439 n=1 Tax=Drosophila gunungcola TaxID=103775 RepID=UPI0022E2EF09|nr:uncharacterized protein LOC128253439 [Drosophila gunungcola]